MAMDKNELTALLTKVPKLNKDHELHPDQQLIFLYLQRQERRKILYRAKVQILTATEFAEVDDNAANETASQQIKESTAQMKALKWEINGLSKAIAKHIEEHGDLAANVKAMNQIDA